MNRSEEAVMHCLTANGETFVSSEPDLAGRWSQPDFVAIRPPKKKVYVVEVTESGNPVGLIAKVKDREKQWLTPLRRHLESLGIVDPEWSYTVLVFVRRDQLASFERRVRDETNVKVLCLEEAYAHWEWSDVVSTPIFSFETDQLRRVI